MKYTTKNVFIFLSIIVAIGFAARILMINISTKSRQNIIKHPKKYCYEDFGEVINPAFILDNLIAKEAFVRYHEIIFNDPMASPPLSFPITTLPQRTPVYVMDYTEDSVLVEVVCYYDRGPSFAAKSHRGWVYYKTLHDNPADTSKIAAPVDMLELIKIHEERERREDSLKKVTNK